MATIAGTGGNDDIVGTPYADNITAGTGNDTVNGGRGPDVITMAVPIGFAADDEVTATGGAGRDTYRFDSGARAWGLTIVDFTAGVGGDRIDVQNLRQYSKTMDSRVGEPFIQGTGFLRLVQSGDDTLLQFDEDGAGSLYDWHTAATLLKVDAGTLRSDNFLGIAPDGNGVAGVVRIGTAFADDLHGSFLDDTLRGGEGADILRGGGGNDWIEGGYEVDGGDTIEGGTGDDTLLGGGGNDVITGWSGNDSVKGGAGDDDLSVYAAQGSDTVRGGGGNDVIHVDLNGSEGAQAVEVHGGNGDDAIRVFAALLDGSESLLATGGPGRDTYLFLSGGFAGGLTVTDFQAGKGGDRIDLGALLDYAMGSQGGDPFEAGLGCLRLVQHGADTLLRYNEDSAGDATDGWHTAVVLRGVEASTLTAQNFVGIQALPPI